MFSGTSSGKSIFEATADVVEEVDEIGERGVVGAESDEATIAAAKKNSYNNPSIEEIEAKLNQLAMAGGFGISAEDLTSKG